MEPTIGLEVHVQLKTNTKLFCSCKNLAGNPNCNTCPICLGLPGALPVLNKTSVDLAIIAGLVLNCDIQLISKFDRKHYTYPDLPKGFQITQMLNPICKKGWIDIDLGDKTKRIGITRIHIEEDAGKLTHNTGESFVDLNRAGVPLIEIVSEPEISSPEEASLYLKELHNILTAVGVTNGNLELGNFRCDANISIKPREAKALGKRVELKNINSYRLVADALEVEINRQIVLCNNGEVVIQSTRSYNPETKTTHLLRSKEVNADYMFMPEPDLNDLVITTDSIDAIRAKIPELPKARLSRYVGYGLLPKVALTIINNTYLYDLFEVTSPKIESVKGLANLLVGPILSLYNSAEFKSKLTTSHLIDLLKLRDVSNLIINEVVKECFASGRSVADVIKIHNLIQINDLDILNSIVDKVLVENEDQVRQYKEGNIKVFAYFIGKIMKASSGKANPNTVKTLLTNRLVT